MGQRKIDRWMLVAAGILGEWGPEACRLLARIPSLMAAPGVASTVACVGCQCCQHLGRLRAITPLHWLRSGCEAWGAARRGVPFRCCFPCYFGRQSWLAFGARWSQGCCWLGHVQSIDRLRACTCKTSTANHSLKILFFVKNFLLYFIFK